MSVWGQAPGGGKYHLVFGGRSLCGVELAPGVTSAPDDFEHRCGNCDNRWRAMGRENRRPRKAKRARTVYRPRKTFKDFEAEG